MSSSYGAAFLSEPEPDCPVSDAVGWFRYDGTSDVACGRLFRTSRELSNNWRKDDVESGCAHPGQDVYLCSSYGGGFGWWSRACLTCMVIVGERDPWHDLPPGEEQYTGWGSYDRCFNAPDDDVWPWMSSAGDPGGQSYPVVPPLT